MPTFEQKVEIIQTVSQLISESDGIVFVYHKGMNVLQVKEFRKVLRPSHTTFQTVKNTLLHRALERAGIAVSDHGLLNEILREETSVAFAQADFFSTAKILTDYIASNRNTPLRIKGGLIGNRLLTHAEVKAFATIPPREQLIAQTIGLLQSPIRGLIYTLDSVPRTLIRTLEAIVVQQSDTTDR